MNASSGGAASYADDGGASYADRALEHLREWPGLQVCGAGQGTGIGIAVSSRQIVQLRRPDQADLCLTWPVVRRLGAALADSGQVQFEPGDDWIRVRLGVASDLALLESLVSVAIQANAPAA